LKAAFNILATNPSRVAKPIHRFATYLVEAYSIYAFDAIATRSDVR